MDKLRYALIGCGRISPNHIGAAKANSGDLEIEAICDLNEEKMKKLAEKFELKNVRMYTDYHEMLEKEKPQLVAVATDSGKHAAIAIDCMRAGCNVIVEKPMAMSLADADKMIAVSREMDVRLCINHQNRFNSCHPADTLGRRDRALRQAISRRGEYPLVPRPRLLRRRRLARQMGERRRHADEPVHSQYRPAQVDDGRRGRRGHGLHRQARRIRISKRRTSALR
jgi:hypothetical protein